jgi:virginiamycin B lyase
MPTVDLRHLAVAIACALSLPQLRPQSQSRNALARPTAVATPRYLRSYKIPGSNLSPAIVEGPDHNLWFAENNAIARMTPTGKFSHFKALRQNQGLAVSSDRAIWFLCANSYEQICTMTKDGKLAVLQGYAYLFGAFALGSDRNLWSYGTYFQAVVGKVTPSGSITYYDVPSKGRLQGLTAGKKGYLWFTDYLKNKVGSITTSGNIREYTLHVKNGLPGPLTLGPDGNIWVGPEAYEKLIRVAPDGSQRVYPTQYQASNLVTGHAPYIYDVQETGQIVQFDVRTGKHSVTWPPKNFSCDISSAAVGPDGNLWTTC